MISHVHATVLIAGSLTLGSTAVLLAVTAQTPPAATPASLTLKSIRENRVLQVVKAADDAMVMMGDTPGLLLTFGITLPEGRRLLELQQPEKVIAKDSAGTDLSQIEEGFSGEREYVDDVTTWNDEGVTEITMRLASSARAATTFDVTADFTANLYTGTTVVKASPTVEWIDLDAAQFGGKVQIRLSQDNDSFGIEFKPDSVKELIEKLEVVSGDTTTEGNGWFSDGRTVTFMIDAKPEGSVTAHITVRTGVETIPLKIELKGQALP